MRLPQTIPNKQSLDINLGPEPKVIGVYRGHLLGFREFLRSQGVGLVVAVKDVPDEFIVNVNWQTSIPASVALRQFAMQLPEVPPVVRRDKDLYIVGPYRDDDLSCMVLWSSREDASELVMLLGTSACKVTQKDDVIVVRDQKDGLLRITELWPAISSARGQWLVEVRFVEVSNSYTRKAGIDTSLTGNIALSLANADITDALDFTGSSAAFLSGLLSADRSNSNFQLLTQGQVFVCEGDKATLNIGEEIPVPKKTVSESGTVTTTDFEYISSGFNMEITCLTDSKGKAKFEFLPEISTVSEYVEGVPVKVQRKVQSSAVLRTGGIAIIGGFSESKISSESKGIPFLPDSWFSDTAKDSSVYVVCQVRRLYETPEYEPGISKNSTSK